jgi:hypothetical protein
MSRPMDPPPASATAAGLAANGATLITDGMGLVGSTVFAMAGAAPGQTIAIVLALLVQTAAYGTIVPMILTTAGLLCIAVAFQRLNMWRQNAGASYEWAPAGMRAST